MPKTRQSSKDKQYYARQLARNKYLTAKERTTLREMIKHFETFKKGEKMRKDEDLCLYKRLEQNPDSTTFLEIRDNRKANPELYKCIDCNGFDKKCKNYESGKRV